MRINFCVLGVLTLFVPTESKSDEHVLSRTKRFVAFPEGSTLIFALCMTAQTILPMGIFTEGVNWGIAYQLPNRTSLSSYIKDKPGKYMSKKRHRRDLYGKFEAILDSMGFDGRSCIFRALCESARLNRIGQSGSLAEELVRLLFKFPHTPRYDEPEEHALYHRAYRRGRAALGGARGGENEQQGSSCAGMFPQCSISVVDLVLGYYNDENDDDVDNRDAEETHLLNRADSPPK